MHTQLQELSYFMAHNIFKGLGIALITPFQEDGSVDYKSLIRLVEYQLNNGADFFCILATTGETPTLTAEEKQKIKDLIVDLVGGRVPILMGCGGNNTAAVVEELQTGDFRGIDGVLSVCPYYNKPSQEGLYQHFKAIAAATKLPVVLYNVPGRTGVNLKAETTVRLAHDCPNIVAIKEASGNLEQVDEIIKNKPRSFDVISGDDALTFPMISCGAVGVISVIGNALPREFCKCKANMMVLVRYTIVSPTSLPCSLSMAILQVSRRCSTRWDISIMCCDCHWCLRASLPCSA